MLLTALDSKNFNLDNLQKYVATLKKLISLNSSFKIFRNLFNSNLLLYD